MTTEGRYADAAGGWSPTLGRAVVFGAAVVASWLLLSSPASADEAGEAPDASDTLAAVVDPLAAALLPGPDAAPQTAISTTGDAGPAPTVDQVAATVSPMAPAVAAPTTPGPVAPESPNAPAPVAPAPLPLLGEVAPVVAGARSAVEQVAKPLLDPVKGAVAPVADPVVGAVRPVYDPVAANVLTPLYTPAAVVAPDELAAFLVDPVAALEGHAWAPGAFAGAGSAAAAPVPAVTDAAALGADAGTAVPGLAAGPAADAAGGDDAEGLSRHLAVPANLLAADGSARGDVPTAPAPPAPVDPASSRGSLPAAPAGPVSGLAGGGSATGARDVPDRGHGAVADAVAGVRAMASDRRALAVPRVVGASVNAGSRPAVTPD